MAGAMSDEEIATAIQRDKIDILVDLSLHMARNRLLVFARKPAPVQVTYLGYCGTSGLDTMDYRLSDPFLDPPGSDPADYSEETIRLPRSYWCYEPASDSPAVNAAPASSSGEITFGCLNNFAKVSPGALDLWAEILMGSPRARLLLNAPEGWSRSYVQERLLGKGVARERLAFIGVQSRARYLETFGKIHIALDPFPYGGGITSCDGLWMGTPLVTLSGRTAVGRGGRSILTNIDLPELIAETPQQYVEIAVALGADRSRLERLRMTLRDRMEQSQIRNEKGHAREIETAYRHMWAKAVENGW
jgi:protein O-GlcNAc transferase